MPTFVDNLGRVMVGEPAGGVGGGMTSQATRPATEAEIRSFHEQEVAQAQAVLDTAKDKRDNQEKQDVVIGAQSPPGPLDPDSLVAQGAVGSPGNPDPRLGVPLGGHTEQQGQPQDPVDAGIKPPAVPEKTRESVAPPEKPSATVSGQMATPRGGPGSTKPGSDTTPAKK